MDPNPESIRKPFSLTDEEWIAILRAHGQGYWQYVFGSFHLVWAVGAVCLTAIPTCLEQGQDGLTHFRLRHETIQSFGGLLVGILALVIVLRTIDWWGRRKTARAAGL